MSRSSRPMEDARVPRASTSRQSINGSGSHGNGAPMNLPTPLRGGNTSVNIANAVNQARQSGAFPSSNPSHTMPPPSSGYLTDSAPVKETHLPPPPAKSGGSGSGATGKAGYRSRNGTADRGKSPAEFMQERARALSPVAYDEEGDQSLHSYLLAEPRKDRRAGSASVDRTAQYQSFSLDTSAQLNSASFSELDKEVEQAKAASKRRSRGQAGTAAYVPAEGDEASGSEASEGEGGEGVAARMDRRTNRGVMPEKGPGYLGMGLAFQSGAGHKRNGRELTEIIEGRVTPVTLLEDEGSAGEESPRRGKRGTSMRGRRSGTAASATQKSRDRYAEEQAPFTPPMNRRRANGTATPAPAPRSQKELTYEPRSPVKSTKEDRPTGPGPLAFPVSLARLLATGVSGGLNLILGWLKGLLDAVGGGSGLLKIAAALAVLAYGAQQLLQPSPSVDRPESGLRYTKPVSRGWSSTPRSTGSSDSVGSVVDWPDEPESWRNTIQDSLAGLTRRVDSSDGKQSTLQEQQDRWTASLRQTEQDLRAQLTREVAQARQASESSERQLVELSAQLDQITAELERIKSLPREFADFRDASEQDGRRTRERLAGVESKLEKVEKDLAAGISEERFLAMLERALPSRVPVSQQGGKMSIAPGFLAELQRLLTPADPSSGKTRATWNDFLLDNEDALRTWTIAVFENEARSKGFVNRHEFTEILKREIAAILPAQANIKDASGRDVTSTLTAMIDAALLRYSKDVIARADHALATAGGDIIPHLTSPTLMLERPRLWKSLFLGTRSKRGRDPTIILWGETTPGVCWPFAGSEGQVGIKLGGRVKVTDITIDHVPRELVPAESMQGAAPKDVEVWMPVDAADAETLRNFRDMHPEHEAAITGDPVPNHFLLTTFTYSTTSANHIQTFPISTDVQALGLSTHSVLVRFRSNWGAGYTCIYRVRVHGEDYEDAQAALETAA